MATHFSSSTVFCLSCLLLDGSGSESGGSPLFCMRCCMLGDKVMGFLHMTYLFLKQMAIRTSLCTCVDGYQTIRSETTMS